MITRTEILVRAPAAAIYALAADPVAWPRLLPHYRYVRRVAGSVDDGTLEMGARRDAIPVAWTARHVNVPGVPEIRFTHVRGWTRGMDVVWRFLPEGDATRVVIEHALDFRLPFAPFAARWIGERIVGAYFVEGIAGRTLATFRALAEASARGGA